MSTLPAFSPDDLASPAVIADPYPAYDALRDLSPVRYVRVPGGVFPGVDQPIRSWALLRHADVAAALRDHETFSSKVTSAIRVLPRFTLLHDDPPRHSHLRRLVSKAFSPRRVADAEPWIKGIAGALLAAMGEGTVEVMQGYSGPLPMQVIASLLGMPREEYPTFRRWSDATIAYSGVSADERGKRMQEMIAYLRDAIAARRKKPTADLISALCEAEVDGVSLDDAEAVGFCVILLVAGNETTMNLLGNMLHILAERPALYQRAREDRSLIEPIIDETLRFECPVQRMARVATRNIEIAGVKIEKGDLIDIFYGAANRDPKVFPDPGAFRLDRSANKADKADRTDNLAFAQGIHYCLGAPLARLEARITLNAFLDRFEAIEPASEPPVRQKRALMPFGFESLKLALKPRASR